MARVALVTGGTRGIGAAISKALKAAGYKVAASYAGNDAAAEKFKADTGIPVYRWDVSSFDACATGIKQVEADLGPIDVLVNNAGIMITKLLKDTTDEDFTRQFDVNVRGTFNTLREAATRLADNGSIINFSTTNNRLMVPTYSTYAATKSAVEQLTRVLSKEIGRGINVNSVSPGPVGTELFLKGKSQELIGRFASMTAFGRIGTPEDITGTVLFLASDDAKWISGQNIGINGAMA